MVKYYIVGLEKTEEEAMQQKEIKHGIIMTEGEKAPRAWEVHSPQLMSCDYGVTTLSIWTCQLHGDIMDITTALLDRLFL